MFLSGRLPPRFGQTICNPSFRRQRGLDAEEILNHGRDVYAFGAQIAMRNLVADLVKLHSPLPLVAAPIQNKRQTIPETQSGIFRMGIIKNT